MPSPTTLYDENLAPVVTLPAGYFLLKNDEAAPDGFISVMYDDIKGFASASAVEQVDYTPVNKYETTVKFRCDNDGQPVNLRAEPRRAASILTVLGSSAEGHSYGTAAGDALIAGAGNIWYYVNAGGTRGYCYSAHVEVDDTPPNIIEKEDPPVTPVTVEPATQEQQPMSSTAAIIFIVALCVPVPFIMFYLFRKPKNKD